MAVDVVDLLESVEIEVQQGTLMIVATCLHDLLFESVFEQLAIRKPCEFVEVCLAVQRLFAFCTGKSDGETTCQVDAATHAVFFHVEPGRRTQQ